jgi:hypothetical protein
MSHAQHDNEPCGWTPFKQKGKDGRSEYPHWDMESGEPAVAFFTTKAQAMAYHRSMGWDLVTYGIAILSRDDALHWLRGMRDGGISWVLVNPTAEGSNAVHIGVWLAILEKCSALQIRAIGVQADRR